MKQPVLSVIIPTYNRALLLERCLESFSAQTFSRDRFEVLVIDDGSSDNTRALLKEKNFPFALHPVFQNHGGAAKARNRGILTARGRVVVFTDDDCIPTPSFLERHYAVHQKENNRLVRGPVLIVRSVQETRRTNPSLFSYSMNFFCTSNASLPREKIVAVGGFDETFDRWEDAELGFRLRKLGLKMHFLMNAVVHHLKPVRRLGELIQTAIRDGKSARKVYERHPSFRTWMSGGLHPFSRFTGMAIASWVDREISRMNPDEPVSGLLERLVFHRYFVKGLRNR